tara:strand:- start:1803 stop:2036 length:234 start_codon:yes stop_codon:yes gene_type:complete
MKQQTRTFEVFTISQTARLFGYKSTKTLYRLLNKGVLDDYLIESTSGILFLQLEPQGCIPLEQKIKNNIQSRVYNVL